MLAASVKFAQDLFLETCRISSRLFKLMIPILIVVKILQEMGGIVFLGKLLSPVMGLVGLRGSMGLAWATTLVANLYGGMIVFATLTAGQPVTVAQTTVLSVMMLIAHTLPIELRIAQKAGVRLRFTGTLRMGCAFLLGFVLNRVYQWGGWLQQPLTGNWMPPVQDSSIMAWAFSQVRSLAMIFMIIMALLLLLKIIARLGLTEVIVRFMSPVLRLLGIGPSATTITIIGMTLGLAYGGGLIIQEALSGRIHKRDVLFSLTLMALCHSIIEDTIVVSMMGAHLSGTLWARTAFALVFVFLLVRVISLISDRTLDRLFVRPPTP